MLPDISEFSFGFARERHRSAVGCSSQLSLIAPTDGDRALDRVGCAKGLTQARRERSLLAVGRSKA